MKFLTPTKSNEVEALSYLGLCIGLRIGRFIRFMSSHYLLFYDYNNSENQSSGENSQRIAIANSHRQSSRRVELMRLIEKIST